MPKAHQAYLEWTPERIVRWTGQAGPATRTLVERLIASKPHPQQGFRAALGIMRLGKIYGPERLEAASERALRFGALSYRSLASILKCGLDRAADPAAEARTISGVPARYWMIRERLSTSSRYSSLAEVRLARTVA